MPGPTSQAEPQRGAATVCRVPLAAWVDRMGPGGLGGSRLTKSPGPSRTRGLAAGATWPSPAGPRPAPPREGEGSGVGPVSAFPHSLGSRRRWAASATLVSRRRSVCFVSDTSGPPLMVRPRATLRYVPRRGPTCSSCRETSGKVRLASGWGRVSRQGEGEPGLSVRAVSQNAEDSDRTERAPRIVLRVACRAWLATRPRRRRGW